MKLETEIAGAMPKTRPKEESGESLVGGALSLTVCGVVSQVINYGIHIGVGRLLAPSVYGYFGIIVSTFSIMETILRWGLSRAVAFHIARERSSAGTILKKSLRLQAVYAFVCFTLFFSFADRLALFLGDPALASYLRWGAFFIIAFAFVPVYGGFFNGIGAFSHQGIMSVIRSVLKLILILALLAYGMEIYGVIVAYLASTIAIAGYGWWWSRGQGESARTAVQTRQILAFGLPLFVSSLAFSVLMRMDLFMVQSLLGDRELTGLYAAAVALIKAPYFLSLGPAHVVFRRVAQLRAGNRAEARGFVSKAVYYYILGLAPVPFILSACAEPILALTFGEQYVSAAPAYRILSFYFFFMIFLDVVLTLIAGMARPRWSMALTLGLLPLQFLLIQQWSPMLGLRGVALATTVSWALGTAAGATYLIRQGYLRLPNWRTFAKAAVASVAIYCLTWWISPSGLWLLAYCPLVYVLYLGLVRLMGELNNDDVRELIASVRDKLRPARR